MSILVRPAAGGNAVLLNVPRSVAAKVDTWQVQNLQEVCIPSFSEVQIWMFDGQVKQGTTLSFSASNEQKYTVSWKWKPIW